MTDDEQIGGDERSWWQSGAQALPDVEAILGPEGMAAVGGVADEALKLFVVLRDRLTVPPESTADGVPAPASAWSAMIGQLASGAVKAVNEIAANAPALDLTHPAGDRRTAGEGESGPSAAGQPGQPVQPGEAAACAYCPICQAVALFRTVPMSTWQRLATSVVEVADAARDLAGTASGPTAPVVVTVDPDPDTATGDPVDEFLQSILDDDGDQPRDTDGPTVD